MTKSVREENCIGNRKKQNKKEKIYIQNTERRGIMAFGIFFPFFSFISLFGLARHSNTHIFFLILLLCTNVHYYIYIKYLTKNLR